MSEIAAKGTQFQIGDGGGPETFTTIAQVRDITGPGLSVDTIDTSHHATTNGWRTKLAGLKDGGDVGLELLFDPAETTHGDVSGGLLDDMNAGTLRNFKIIFPDTGATEWDIAGIVTGFEPSAPHDGALTASVTIAVSGQPTLA